MGTGSLDKMEEKMKSLEQYERMKGLVNELTQNVYGSKLPKDLLESSTNQTLLFLLGERGFTELLHKMLDDGQNMN